MADAYRDSRFRCGPSSADPFYPWEDYPNALSDIRAGINQNTTTPGGEVNSWASVFGPYVAANPSAGTGPAYDPGGAASAGVNGQPSVNFDGVDNYMGSGTGDAEDIIGTMPGGFSVVLTCRVISVVTAAAPSFSIAALNAANAYRVACKVYRKTADSLYYAFVQRYNGSFTYLEQVIGATLPNRLVLCYGWESPNLYISVNGAAPATSAVSAPEASTNGQEWLLGLDFLSSPVYSTYRLSRQTTKGNGSFPTADIAAELARTA